MENAENISLIVMSWSLQRKNPSLLLGHIFVSSAFRFLFIADKNVQLKTCSLQWFYCFTRISCSFHKMKQAAILLEHFSSEHSILISIYLWQKCIGNNGDYFEKMCFVGENMLYPMVLLCFLYLLLSKEINRRYMFWKVQQKEITIFVYFLCHIFSLWSLFFLCYQNSCSKSFVHVKPAVKQAFLFQCLIINIHLCI